MESCIHGLDINYCVSCKPKYIRKPIISQKYAPKILDNESPIHPIPLYFLFPYISLLRKFNLTFDAVDQIINQATQIHIDLLDELNKKNVGKIPWKFPFGRMKKSLNEHEYKEMKYRVIKYIDDPIWKKLPENFNDNDICSYFILKLKNKDTITINNFANWMLDCGIIGKNEKVICCVPPSTVDKESGTHVLCDAISKKCENVFNARDSVVRTKQIQSSHKGGVRSKEIHLESMEIRNSEKLAGKRILIIDDVATTGSSLAAAIEKIKVLKPISIEAFVLGRTEYEYK